jgi:glyoxylase-like metal-dependent hydrolase (beta-lactamase superfamily II)
MHKLPSGVTFFERGWLSSNNVLIQDSEHAVLVDTGYWTHASQTASLLSSVLKKNKPLTSIVNTHLHSDHCGGNAHLQQLFPSIKTYIPPGHASFVDDWDADALTYTPTGQHCPSFTKSGVLSNGDSLLIGDATWRVYCAPGHDPHAIILFNERDGVLISADALWENGFGVVFPEIEGLEAFDEVEATLQIIEQLKPKLILPGHGSAFTDISGALKRARTRLAQFRGTPEKHALYAAKVLLKFKLLDLQKVKYTDFVAWATSASYLHLLQSTYSKAMKFDAWILEMCKSLEKSGACALDEQYIVNIN